MAIEFACPACGGTLRVGDDTAGQVVRCGGCMTMLRVPDAAAESAPSARESPYEVVPPPGAPIDVTPLPDDEPPPAVARPVARPRRDRDRDRDRDYSDERPRHDRPARRRPPPPPKGRGVFFWLVLVGGILLLGTVGCCGGIFLILPGENWQKHESAKGGFAVDLPAKPRPDMDKISGVPAEPGMHTEGTILLRRGEAYAIVYRDLPPANTREVSDEKLIDEAVKAMRTDKEVRTVLRDEPITVSGFPGREIEFRGTDGGWYAARVIVADTRIYVLVGGGKFVKAGNANIHRFLGSFEITDPQLKNVAQQRADAAKQAKVWEDQRKADEAKRLEEERVAEEKRKEEVRIAEEKRKEDLRIAEEKRKENLIAEKKRQEALRHAAELQAKLRAYRETIRMRNNIFQRETYDGPPVPEAETVVGMETGIAVYPFEKEVANGVVAQSNFRSVIRPGVLGRGVRESGAYLLSDSKPATMSYGPGVDKTLQDLLRDWDGYTVAGWVRVRYLPVGVITVVDADGKAALGVGVGRTHVTAHVNGLKPVTLKHPWKCDAKWHHVALVCDRESKMAKVRLYFDGSLVASSDLQTRIPPLKGFVWMGKVEPNDDAGWPQPLGADGKPGPPAKDEIVGAIDECVIVGRPLTDAEVRRLAGRWPLAPAPRPVKAP